MNLAYGLPSLIIGTAYPSSTMIWFLSPTTFNCSPMQPPSGFGGFYHGRQFTTPCPPQMLHSPQSSALFERYSLVVAAFLWGKDWTAGSILDYCDNEATIHCINKACSHSLAHMPIPRCLIWVSACDQFIITAKHIPASKNLIAGSLAHFIFQKFRALAPEADPSSTHYLTIYNLYSCKPSLKTPP